MIKKISGIKLSSLKTFDRLDIAFLDAHTICQSWVEKADFDHWVENEQVYVRCVGFYMCHNDKFLTISLGYGAMLGEGMTTKVISPMSIPIGAIMEMSYIERAEDVLESKHIKIPCK